MTSYRNTADNTATGYRTTENDHQNRATSAGSTTPGACARAREAESRAAMMRGQYVDCCEYYVQSFRRHLPAVVQREIAEHIRDGMSADVIRAAMDETQLAPRPSWAYCHAILKRCDLEQIRTMKDWNESKARYQSSRNPALNYDQRTYTDDMFGEDFFVDLSQY